MKRILILSGAGMSAESGISTFRDAGGLWENHEITEVASPEGFTKDPELVLHFYNLRRKNVMEAEPNAGHLALKKLESKFHVDIVTQNIDDLHERAGSTNVMHLHGEILKSRSSLFPSLIYGCKVDIKMGDLCEKQSQLRPHIVWFGEAVPMIEPAMLLCGKADIIIVIGTSLAVYPAAGLIHYAQPKAKRYLIDPQIPDIQLNDITHIQDTAGLGVPVLVNKLLDEQNK